MPERYAIDFADISDALNENSELREEVRTLIMHEPIVGKVVEGGNRVERLRLILTDVLIGRIDLEQAFTRAETPMATSKSPTCGRVKIPQCG